MSVGRQIILDHRVTADRCAQAHEEEQECALFGITYLPLTAGIGPSEVIGHQPQSRVVQNSESLAEDEDAVKRWRRASMAQAALHLSCEQWQDRIVAVDGERGWQIGRRDALILLFRRQPRVHSPHARGTIVGDKVVQNRTGSVPDLHAPMVCPPEPLCRSGGLHRLGNSSPVECRFDLDRGHNGLCQERVDLLANLDAREVRSVDNHVMLRTLCRRRWIRDRLRVDDLTRPNGNALA